MAMFSQDHQTFIRKLPEQDRSFLLGTLFLYVFRGTDQSSIRTSLAKRGIAFDLLGWRRQLHSNGALLRDGKVSMYRNACGQADTKKIAALTPMDRRFVASAMEFKPLSKRLGFLNNTEQRPPMTVVEFDRFAADVLTSDDLTVYIKKYVRRKMSFLKVSYGRTFQELEMDLLSWAHYALLRSYPRFDDVGHGIAIAKTVVKHRGVNLIMSMTAAKQNQLITNEDGSCESTTVSLSGIADDTGQFLTADGTFIHRSLLVVGINGVSSNDSSPDWETLQAIQQLMRSSELTTSHKTFLQLMLGVHDEDFSTYLGEPNEDVVEKVDYMRYMKKVCEFLGLPLARATRFLGSLKPHLGGISNLALN